MTKRKRGKHPAIPRSRSQRLLRENVVRVARESEAAAVEEENVAVQERNAMPRDRDLEIATSAREVGVEDGRADLEAEITGGLCQAVVAASAAVAAARAGLRLGEAEIDEIDPRIAPDGLHLESDL